MTRSLFWLLLCCCCCYVALGENRKSYTGDSDESIPTTTDYRKLCSDHRKNQDESDIDCGGVKCPRCEEMKTCKMNCDCISGNCQDNKCSLLSSCEDRIRNQDESDVDCGGVFCRKCPFLKTCKSECDCVSGICKDNKCIARQDDDDDEPSGNDCVPTCKNNGKCIDGKCSCPKGFRGPICEAESHDLCSAKDLANSDPVLTITFGNGNEQYSRQTPKDFDFMTSYKQQFQGRTAVGYFNLVNSIPDDTYHRWHTVAKDHTGDQGGYMFFVNGNPQSDEFYRGTVKHLCIGRRYEFSVYMANACKPNLCTLRSNVLFEVRSTVGNELLAQLSSGDVIEHDTFTWKKYGLSFTATTKSVVLLMISHVSGSGVAGNYLAIDDISLRVCGGGGSGLCHSDK